MTNPDELPAWLWIPGAIVLWSTWIGICIADGRERLARTLHDTNHTDGSRDV